MPIYGELLQLTDDFNFSILQRIEKLPSTELVETMLRTGDYDLLAGLVRSLIAAPYTA